MTDYRSYHNSAVALVFRPSHRPMNLQVQPPSLRHSHVSTLWNRSHRSYWTDIWAGTVLGLMMRLHVVNQVGLNAGHPATGLTELS